MANHLITAVSQVPLVSEVVETFDVIAFLGLIGLILLMGIICAVLSQTIRIPNVLLLLLVGMALGMVRSADGTRAIAFPVEFLSAIGILALAMIVFESSSRLKLWQVEAFSGPTVKLVLVFLITNSFLLTIFTWLLWPSVSIWLIILFATLMSGTDPATVLSILEKERKKIFEILKLESILNTPFVVLLPFIILDIMPDPNGPGSTTGIFSSIAGYSLPFLGQFVVGIGSGVIMGLIVFKLMSQYYSERISPLAVFTATLLTYVLAEMLDGNGVLAVTVLGLFIGNIALANKENLMKFSVVLSKSLEILVFVLVGLIIRIPNDIEFIVKSLILFILYLGIRYLALYLTLRKEFSTKELIFMSLNAAKGIAVATVIFALSAQAKVPGTKLYQMGGGVDDILNLTLLFLLYSIVVSSVALMFAGKFVELQPGLKVNTEQGT